MWAVGGKIYNTMAKSLHGDMKKAIAAIRKTCHTVKDISERLKTPADTAYVISITWTCLCGPY